MSPCTLARSNGEVRTSTAPASRQRAICLGSESAASPPCWPAGEPAGSPDEANGFRIRGSWALPIRGLLAPEPGGRRMATGTMSFGPSCTWISEDTCESSCKPYDSWDSDEKASPRRASGEGGAAPNSPPEFRLARRRAEADSSEKPTSKNAKMGLQPPSDCSFSSASLPAKDLAV